MSLNTRSFKVKRIPGSLGGGWNLQLVESGRIVRNHKEPANQFPEGYEFDGKTYTDLALLACQLNGDLWIREGGLPV